MKRLTRDEFKALVTRKTPVAGLQDGSSIELTVGQAMKWFDQSECFSKRSLFLSVGNWVFLGEKNDSESTGLYQVGGRQ